MTIISRAWPLVSRLAILAGALSLGACVGTGPKPASEALESGSPIQSARFGVVTVSPGGVAEFREAAVVPAQPGTIYGWRIKVTKGQEKVKFVETLTMPASAVSWDTTRETAIGSDGKTAVTKREVAVNEEGYVEHFWAYTDGDPLGTYAIKVEILNQSFNFSFKVGARSSSK